MKGGVAAQAILLLLPLLCFHVLSDEDGPAAAMEEREIEALYSTIQGFVGKNWNGSLLYPDPCGSTPIQGITCDLFDNGFWYVVRVNIGPVYDNSILCTRHAKFSPSLFELRHLSTLSISSCFTSITLQPAAIPYDYWNKLSSSLKTLQFRSNNRLTGQIPPIIGQLVNLQSLVLTENSLSGQLPFELGNLVNLKMLSLSSNRFSGQLPVSIWTNMTELLIMDISRNSLNAPLHSSPCGFTSLMKLDLSINNLTGKLPEELGSLKNLIMLDLSSNNLTGGLPPSLHRMASLQAMLLSNNPLGGDIMVFEWKYLRNLTYLDLSRTGLVGVIPETIAELRRLRFLGLNDNKLSGSVSAKLAALRCLRALYLNGNNLTGELGFSKEFYKRMGVRFASWNNPNLCYKFGGGGTRVKGPAGVKKCKSEEK